MKVREYLHFAAGLKGIPAVKRKSEVERVMERLKITDVQKRLIRNLSKGYKQRVGFAQALLGDPPVLILDDPFSALDRSTEDTVFAALQAYANDKVVFLISHRLYHFPQLQNIIFMGDGKTTVGTHEELLQSSDIYREVYDSQNKAGGENHG